MNDGQPNERTDSYGCSIENRSRLLLEVVEAITSVWGSDRVVVRIAPAGTWNHMRDSNPAALFTYVAEQLNRFGVAYGKVWRSHSMNRDTFDTFDSVGYNNYLFANELASARSWKSLQKVR